MNPQSFVGRGAELDTLRAVLDTAAGGRLQAAFVTGEPGIGKTRLLTELLRGDQRFRILTAKAEEIDRNRPFGVLLDALASARTTTLTAAADTGSPDPGFMFRQIEAIIDAVEQAALQGPVALVLDDLHWADESSLVALRTMTRRLAGMPLALLAAFRSVPRAAGLQQLLEALTPEQSATVTVGPLATDAVAQVVTEVLQAAPDETVLAAAGRASGNPFLLTELLSALSGSGAVVTDGGHASLLDDGLPPTLRDTMVGRLGYLPPQTFEVLKLAAILGSAFHPRDLATVSGGDTIEVVQALQPAIAGTVLEAAENELRFRHDLIHEAVYDAMPRSVREALHLEAARKLVPHAQSAVAVARHFSLGASAGDAQAVDWLRRAAREIQAAPHAAEEMLTRALELAGVTHPDRGAMRFELAVLLGHSGRAAQAETALRELLGEPLDQELEARARLLLVQVLFAQGRWSDEVAEIERSLQRPLPDVHRGRLLAEAALARLWLGDAAGASRDGEEAVRLARATDDDVAESLALGHLTALAGGRGALTHAVELADQGLRAARSAAARMRQPHLPLGIALLDVDRFDDADENLQEGRRLAEAAGAAWAVPLYQTVRSMHSYWVGGWDDAVAEAEAGLALGEETGTHPVAFAAHCVLATIAVHRDALDAAEASLEQATGIVNRSGPQWAMWWLARARALVQEARGQVGGALETLTTEWRMADERGFAFGQLFIGSDLVRLSRDRDPDLARTVAARLEDLAGPEPVHSLLAAALFARGLVSGGAEELRGAVAAYERSGRAREAAVSLEALAPTTDDRAEAKDALRSAASSHQRRGALRDLARTTAQMRALGIPPGARGPRARPSSGWASLTPTEERVVQLAAQGLTNPQIGSRLFISRYTVATHLSHVYDKLAIRSRVELAAEFTRRRQASG